MRSPLLCPFPPFPYHQVYTPDAQVLITAAVNGSRAELERGLAKHISTRDPAKSLARLTWDRDPAWLDGYAQAALGGEGEGLVCFQVSERRCRVGGGLAHCGWAQPAGGGPVRSVFCLAAGLRAAAGRLCHVAVQSSRQPTAQLRLAPLQTVLAGTGSLSRQMAPVDALPYRQVPLLYCSGCHLLCAACSTLTTHIAHHSKCRRCSVAPPASPSASSPPPLPLPRPPCLCPGGGAAHWPG